VSAAYIHPNDFDNKEKGKETLSAKKSMEKRNM